LITVSPVASDVDDDDDDYDDSAEIGDIEQI
jgi:hypothetical protein